MEDKKQQTFSNATARGVEYKIREDQNLLSRTNTKGIITYAAQAFVDVSGYSREELIGAPHSIVRHPDMPKEAFNDLWRTISKGENWVGLVKNRRKNGDYYWVRAHVTPIVESGVLQGYTSVRIKPTEDEIRFAETTYAKIRNEGMRGIRLDKGRVVKTGLAHFFSLPDFNSFKSKAYLFLLVNLFLLFISALFIFSEKDAAGNRSNFVTNLFSFVNQEVFLFSLVSSLAVVGITAIFMTLGAVNKELKKVKDFTMQIASGNMVACEPDVQVTEFTQVASMLAVMRRSLINISTDVRESLNLVRPATSAIAQSGDELAARTEQQAASLQQTAASMEQITATVLQNADNAKQASHLANSAVKEVKGGGEAVHAVVSRMDAITQSSNRIAEIVGVIDSIAFQTNILALNASIEAARAGEQGKGFAVVANEVRNLATRSAKASGEVRDLVQNACDEIVQGELQVERAESAISEVVEIVNKLNNFVNEITVASEEQQRSIEQINIAITQMDQVTQRNAGMVVASARAAHTLETQVGELSNSIDVLRLQKNRGADAVPKANTAAVTSANAPRAALPEKSAARKPASSSSANKVTATPAAPKQYRNDTAETAHISNDDWESF